MGVPFHYGEEYFIDWLAPRERFGLKDHFALGLMPRIDGLYSEDALAFTDVKHQAAAFSGILISHIHWDHTNHLRFVDADVPVHMGEGTKHILNSWETTSSRANLGKHNYQLFRTGRTVKLDGIEDEPIHVDHSAPAAYGHILHTSAGTVVYTGDLRRHGPRGDMTDEFLERAAKEKVLALIIEGTKVTPEDVEERGSEQEVLAGAKQVAGDAKGHLVVATFYPRDVDRMRTFFRTAKATGRQFVISAKAAHLLGTMAADKRIDTDAIISDDDIRVYFREMKSPGRWETELRDIFGDRAVDCTWVRENQDDLILQLDFEHFAELVDIQPKPGAQFIHSKSEPFEEDEMEEEVMNNWLQKFDLTHHQLHASGHLTKAEVRAAIEQIAPEIVVPVHTEHPEVFQEFHDHVRLPKNRTTLSLGR
jgi:ribonuclease J